MTPEQMIEALERGVDVQEEVVFATSLTFSQMREVAAYIRRAEDQLEVANKFFLQFIRDYENVPFNRRLFDFIAEYYVARGKS